MSSETNPDASEDLGPSGPGPARVLVVDDEPTIREILCDFLRMEGFVVHDAPNGRAALEALAERPYNLVISDLKMPEMGGLELLQAVRVQHPELVVVLMTGYGTVETALHAMKIGAFDYVLKPFKVEEVVHTVQRALEQQRLTQENIALKASLSLYKLASRLGDAVEIDPTLRLIAEVVRDQTQSDRVTVVLLPDEDGVRYEPAHCGGPALTDADLTEDAIELKQPVLATGGRVFRYLRPSPHTESVRSLLALPLTSRGRRLGILLAAREGTTPFVEGQRKLLTILADRAAAAVHNAQLFESLERNFRTSVEVFIAALEEKDRYTRGHSERVAEFAEATARVLGLPDEECDLIYQSGRLHDIGKLTIRAEELNKPAGLTQEEFQRFKAHPGFGEDLLRNIPAFRKLLPGIGMHHEKWDGTGYPRGMKGEEIPMMARIMSIADTYDAMTSHRAYRSALRHQVAVDEIKRCGGTQFDPRVVEAFCVGIDVWRKRREAEGREYPR
ncbi:MAG: HD domain-containing phosphohydrolase [Bradymonadia bacterium]